MKIKFQGGEELKIYNSHGDELMKINGGENIELMTIETSNEKMPYTYLSRKENHVSFHGSTNDLIQQTLGYDLSNAPDLYDITYTKFTQARKHKKKRINKKWMKKYGMKSSRELLKGCRIDINPDAEKRFASIYE